MSHGCKQIALLCKILWCNWNKWYILPSDNIVINEVHHVSARACGSPTPCLPCEVVHSLEVWMTSDWYVFVLFLFYETRREPSERTCHVRLAAHWHNCVCLLIASILCAERQIAFGLWACVHFLVHLCVKGIQREDMCWNNKALRSSCLNRGFST